MARNLFPAGNGLVFGLAFDAGGNAYLGQGDGRPQPIAVVAPDGAVAYLPVEIDNLRSLAVVGEFLFIAEGRTGRVLAYDLTTGEMGAYATGFTTGFPPNIAGSLVVDLRGRLLALWSGGMGYGLFDITDGGDFAGREPMVPVPPRFYVDVNQIAIDSVNNLYVAGALSPTGDPMGIVYISRFNGNGFTPFEPFATGLGDTESVAVLPSAKTINSR